MATLRIRSARPAEAAALSDLALRSKAHWGYSAQFMEACRADLTLDPADCAGESLVVAEVGGGIAGFARLAGTPPEGELSDLWVDPEFMGRGIGRALFQAIARRAERLGFRSLTIDADPHAEAFYLHLGAVRIGESASTVFPGRTLPHLRYVLPHPG